MKIKHDSDTKKFYIPLKGSEAYLKYNLKDNTMDILSVVIPVKHRGKGIAEDITLHAFNYAKKNKYKIIPTCPYVRDTFIKKHKEFNDMVISS